jgi:hypothetical protein
MIFQILLDSVVVEQDIVNIDQENDRMEARHLELQRRPCARIRSPTAHFVESPEPQQGSTEPPAQPATHWHRCSAPGKFNSLRSDAV